MTDVALGTFEVTTMSQMSSQTPPVGATPPPTTYNLTLLQVRPPEGTGPGSINISGLADDATVPTPFSVTDVHLGKRYEVILREVGAP